MPIIINYEMCKKKKCKGHTCVEKCPANALIHGEQIQFDSIRCIDCGVCIAVCKHGAISEK